MKEKITLLTKTVASLLVLVFFSLMLSLGMYYDVCLMTPFLEWHPMLYVYNAFLVLVSIRMAYENWD